MFIKPDLRSVHLSPEKLLDFHLLHNPDHLFGILTPGPGSGRNKSITWSELGHAILDIATELHQEAQTQPVKAPIVGILANGEPVAYFTLFWAILRSGCVPFPISPRNSAPAIVHLLTKTNCRTLYVQFDPTTSSHLSSSNDNGESHSMGENIARNQIQEILKLLPDSFSLKLRQCPSSFKLYPRLFNKEVEKHDAKITLEKLSRIITPDRTILEPVLIVHSSGTTSFPKPIYINKLSYHAWLTAPLYNPEFNWEKQIIAGMILPPFHALGIHYGLVINLSTGAVPGFFHPEIDLNGMDLVKVPNSVNVIEALEKLVCTVAVASPFMITEFASDKSHVDILRKMNRVAFGGGPLSAEIGDKLVNEGVKLCTAYGSTEVGPTSSIFAEPYRKETWAYFEISPHLVIRLIPQDESQGLYELVILSSDRHRCSLSHLETELLPQTYHTNDIIYKHPTLPLYRAVGRLDDQIMLSTSEKTNPGPMEAILVSSPIIKGALMFGRGKPANGVIIEPEENFIIDVKDRQAVEKFIDLIWPSIEEANKFGPSHSRLTRNLILVIDPRITPLPKTNKGQISRSKALLILEKSIEEIYSSSDDNLTIGKVLLDKMNKVMDSKRHLGYVKDEFVNDFLKYVVESYVSVVKNVHLDQDLFSQGCDSLSAKQIRSRIIQLINSTTSKKTDNVPQNLVYQHPTIKELSKYVIKILNSDYQKQDQVEKNLDCTPLINLVERYSPSVINNNVKVHQTREIGRLSQKVNPLREMTLARYILN